MSNARVRNPYARAVGSHPARAATLGTLVVLLMGYIAFGSYRPAQDHFEVKGIFAGSPGLTKRAPVRLAGVDVGAVTKLERGPGNTALVTMRLEEKARPLYSTTSLRIRPRLFLEGGFYIQMNPGLPQGARRLRSGDTIPLGQTSIAVQSDQVLSRFDSQARRQSATIVRELGVALGEDGAPNLRQLTRTAPDTLRVSAIATNASLGITPRELTKVLQSSSAVSTALDEVSSSLEKVTVDGNRTFRVFAQHEGDLQRTLTLLERLLTDTPRTLDSIDRAIPSITKYYAIAKPVLARLPRALTSTAAVIKQGVGLTRDEELPRLLRNLRPSIRRLPAFTQGQIPLSRFVAPVAQCFDQKINPTLDTKLDDDHLSTGQPAWLDAMHAGVNIAGTVANFDGNGTWLRYESGTSDLSVSLGQIPGLGKVVGTANGALMGVRPEWNGTTPPPFHPESDCRTQKLPDLKATAAKPALKTVDVRPLSARARKQVGRRFEQALSRTAK